MAHKGSYLLVILITVSSIIPIAYLAEVNSQPPKESSPGSIICGFIEDDDHCGLPDYLHECSTGKVYSFFDAPSVSRSSHICVVLVNPTVSGYTITSYAQSKIIKDCSECPQISTITPTGPSPTTPSSSPTPSTTQTEPPISTSPSVIPEATTAQPNMNANIMVTLVGVVFVILVVVADLVFARARKEI
jgi:hypothetical protein